MQATFKRRHNFQTEFVDTVSNITNVPIDEFLQAFQNGAPSQDFLSERSLESLKTLGSLFLTELSKYSQEDFLTICDSQQVFEELDRIDTLEYLHDSLSAVYERRKQLLNELNKVRQEGMILRQDLTEMRNQISDAVSNIQNAQSELS
ncbi:hypothetical protein BLNAU_15746 [Blattamonas nauphoetae]|uniref:Uncharacterized protein n=1 Tax=Blattamonas nauphoetae TaxID=2049346 RepID=A0ABQ9XD48_9EUKA|nr:hypothetical protein BLNAU_15746 [Blattamonas nauphoetae]